jgi:putative MATE family efflux protein
MRLRSDYDGDIVRLALPALGALAAEPLYVLVDTAIVGHLGRSQLAALGVAAAALGGVFAIFNFLQYGTTAQVARARGAGATTTADELGVQALWLSGSCGVLVAALVAGFAGPLAELIGAEGQTHSYAVTYLRIASLGLAVAFLTLGGSGYLRGVADLRTPLLIVIWANLANVLLELLFVYGFDWGIAGSAWGTVVAQAAMGAAFLLVIARRIVPETWRPVVALARRLLSLGKWIFLRTASLAASFLLASAVATRFGDASIGAHQIAFQLFFFLALVLDSIAIAGQIIIGRELGAGRINDAYAAGSRMIALSTALGAAFGVALLLSEHLVPRVFTGDPDVLAQAAILWPLFALTQPLAGAVFALDGILIGAADGPFLAGSMLLAFVCCAALLLASLVWDWGMRGVWAALVVLVCVRLAMMWLRFRRRRWLVTGWT